MQRQTSLSPKRLRQRRTASPSWQPLRLAKLWQLLGKERLTVCQFQELDSRLFSSKQAASVLGDTPCQQWSNLRPQLLDAKKKLILRFYESMFANKNLWLTFRLEVHLMFEVSICLPWMVTFLVYSLMHWSYPRDIRHLEKERTERQIESDATSV